MGEEGKALLDKLFDHIESQPVFKFKWTCDVEKCGTTCPTCLHALMWDNRQLQHTATPWARDAVLGKRRREPHRVTISGDEPPYFRHVTRRSCSNFEQPELDATGYAIFDENLKSETGLLTILMPAAGLLTTLITCFERFH